jgi:two-component system nitrogen regulation sensor histidine kinase GlnL
LKTTPSYENIIENLGEGVICVDPSMAVIVFNQSAERMTGLSRAQVLEKPIGKVFTRDLWLVEILEKTVKEQKLFSEYEERLHRRLSEPLPVGVTTSQVFDIEGNITGAVALIKDLSGIMSLETESLRKERLAYIGTFAMNLAHEVKNPLGGIRGAAQLLSKKIKAEGLADYTDVIIRAVDRLDIIVKEMLDFARPGKIEKRGLNIHKVLDEVVLLLTEGHKGPTLVKEYDPSLPPVLGDEDKLTQVLLNLIKNAREAVGEKEGEVRLITRMVTDFHLVEEGSKEAKLATVEIRDTGCGIPPENLEKVFTPFFTTKPGGSGLGMAISYRIIKEHGGFLTIDSKPGEGTRVDVYLPTAE